MRNTLGTQLCIQLQTGKIYVQAVFFIQLNCQKISIRHEAAKYRVYADGAQNPWQPYIARQSLYVIASDGLLRS